MPDTVTRDRLERLVALARAAGMAIMSHYTEDMDVREKDDASPVTQADHDAEAVILSGLEELTPDIPVIAEEEVAAGRVPDVSGGVFWLVDPLDGTKEFIRRNGEFTVNIALIEHGDPVMGVVYAPALEKLYGGAAGLGAFVESAPQTRAPIAVRAAPAEGIALISSRSHANDDALAAYVRDLTVAERKTIGSSLKFCLIAEGLADLYPRFGPTMEWDTAAGQAVLMAAGGSMTTEDGAPFTYGKPEFRNPHFIARGG